MRYVNELLIKIHSVYEKTFYSLFLCLFKKQISIILFEEKKELAEKNRQNYSFCFVRFIKKSS